MRHRQWPALAWATLWLLVAAPFVSAQYTQGLPAGILSIEVDGQPLDAFAVPVTNQASPEITGRVDLGVAAIELAVANGEVVRFAAGLDDQGAFRAAVPEELSDGQYSLYIGDVLVGAFIIEGAIPTDREPGRLLDIARVVPYPADFGESLPGIGFLDGRFFTIEEEAQRSAAGAGVSPGELRELQRSLVESGWLQRYESRLAAPDPDEPAAFAMQVSSFIVEYASGADARTAYMAVIAEEPGADFPTIGNESVLTLLAGTTPDTGTDYQAARLVYRLGPMLGVIVFADLGNQPPDLAVIESVANAVAARGVAIADRETLPLGSMTLRLDATSATGNLARRDFYEVRGGQLTAIFGQNEEQAASQATLTRGTTDVFSSTTSGVFAERRGGRNGNRSPDAEEAASRASPPATPGADRGGEPPGVPSAAITGTPTANGEQTAQIYIKSTLYEFPGAAEADAWLVAQRDQLLREGQSGNATYSEVADAPRLGEASELFASERAGSDAEAVVRGYRVYARQGQIVAVIEVGSVPDLPQRAAINLMEQQLDCVAAQSCAEPASVPGSLFDGREEGE